MTFEDNEFKSFEEPKPEKDNKKTIIIVAAVVLVLCCCCVVAGVGGKWLWENGDSLVSGFMAFL